MRVFALFIMLLSPVLATAEDLPAMLSPAEFELLEAPWEGRILEVVAPGRAAPTKHLPGAAVTHFEADGWTVDYPELPGMVPPPERLARLIGGMGIGAETPVILVPTETDTHAMAAATRIFWTLRLAGHKRVSVLEGGLPGVAQRATAETPSVPTPQPYRLGTAPKISARMEAVFAGQDYRTPPFDTRDRARHYGETKHPRALEKGTIRGAAFMPAEAMIDPQTGFFKSKAELNALFARDLGTPPGPVVLFSDIGYRASLVWFAAHYVMGLSDVRLFDGSYLQWELEGGIVENLSNDMGGAVGG
ncbi:MAG: sulfurtransferase [Magnetospiraceae bacterium]